MSQIADQRTGTGVTSHGSPELKESPTNNALYLSGTSSVDLLEVTESSCLFDPSNCSTGFSITMFIKYRPRGSYSVNGTQMFFGNREGIQLNQGVFIYYDETSKHVNVTVLGSSNYCFGTFGKYNCVQGRIQDFFRRGCTRLLLYLNTNKPHSFFFAEYQLY